MLLGKKKKYLINLSVCFGEVYIEILSYKSIFIFFFLLLVFLLYYG